MARARLVVADFLDLAEGKYWNAMMYFLIIGIVVFFFAANIPKNKKMRFSDIPENLMSKIYKN